jgi:hypothetical protein
MPICRKSSTPRLEQDRRAVAVYIYVGLLYAMEQDMQNREPVHIFKLMAEAYPTSII